ncbi:MAG TPA: iron ABC transporter permease [Thermoanaerobaculia bacterium]|nr:iron ABC transporter permease [Thermoanaerobaculia bacterium]
MTPPRPSRRSRGVRALLAVAAVWLAVAVLAPLLGTQPLPWGALTGADPTGAAILWHLRLPRVLLALAAGGTLALAGLALQTLFRNPLAEPYTLGVASGGALGAALVFTFAGELPGLPLLAPASFAGAVGATALVIALGRRGHGTETGRLLLAGVAVALTCQALILFLQYLSDATETLRMVRWLLGGLSVVGYREVLWVLPWSLLLAALLAARRWELDLLLAGEEIAAARGADVARLRHTLLLATCLAVGSLVAVAGPIGFVGLMVPHMLRRLVGSEHGLLVPACLLGGGAFLALCDLGARTLLAPAELPVGVVTALLGGPFFLWLLRR